MTQLWREGVIQSAIAPVPAPAWWAQLDDDLRVLRALPFATVCVALAAAGNALASGSAVPPGALLLGWALVGVVAMLAARRERSLRAIVGGQVRRPPTSRREAALRTPSWRRRTPHSVMRSVERCTARRPVLRYGLSMASRASIPDSRPRSRWAAGLPAITAEKIVDQALVLTETHGLDNWTVRQLAAAIEAYPAVVYHHVGDREAVVNAVLERVVGMLPVPPTALPWRDWFRVLLSGMRGVLRRYPGVARRLAAHGPGVERAAPIIDRGVTLLQEAGFGKESVLAYNVLLGTACQLMAIEDDREHNPELRARMSQLYAQSRTREDMPGLAAMGAFVHEVSEQPDQLAGFYASFYDYAVERTLDGIAARLEQVRPR
ncbi:TetR/AcrR family transcriptional regulator [Kitasatospora sp. NPDC101155]|uniref:TetR/AcrR family transcriptional regulator n=1 Tax=Kitasatospora sp. NPDC101155 TaxID=3364097 RepID=UPI003818FDBB